MIRQSASKWWLVVALLLFAGLVISRDFLGGFLIQRGLRARESWQLQRAERYFGWAARLTRDPARALVEKAVCLQLRGDFLAAQRELSTLTAARVSDLTVRVRFLNALGVNRWNGNDPEAAMDLHKRSLDLATQIGHHRLQAESLIYIARVLYHLRGEADEPLLLLARAQQLARVAGDQRLQADALRNTGAIYWWHKLEFDRPLNECYLPALEIYQRIGDLHGAGVTLSNIGLVHYQMGDPFQFMKYQNESLKLKERIGDIAGLIDSYGFIGQMYADAENFRKAHQYFWRALELSRQTGNRLAENGAESGLARVYNSLGQFDQAIALLEGVLQRDSPAELNHHLGTLAWFYLRKGEPHVALELQQKWQPPRNSGVADEEIGRFSFMAEAYLALGDLQRSREHLALAEQAISTRTEKSWWPLLHHKLTQAGLMEREGRRGEALRSLLEAAEIEAQTLGASGHNLAPGQKRQVYDRLFALLLTRPTTDAPWADELAFRILEQLRYRSLRNVLVRLSDRRSLAVPGSEGESESFRRIERTSAGLKGRTDPAALEQLRAAYGHYEDHLLRTRLDESRYRLVRRARPVGTEEVRRLLDPQTALVEYVFAGEQLFALVITRSGLRSVALPVTSPALTAKVKLFRALIFSDSQTAGWQPVAEDLRRRLIEPIEQTGVLHGVRRLGLVPFGLLHDLPFAALARGDGEHRRFLVDDYTLFYVPSATFFAHAFSHTPSPDQRAACFGSNGSDEEGLEPLTFATDEARAVAGILGGQPFLDADASETELKRVARRFQLIHVATHALSEPSFPLWSRLKLRSTAWDDGNLTVREILDLGLEADLVTLSACRTGQSSSASGNELSEVDRLGLIEAFLSSGARSVLASLLPVEDRSTTEFMKAFYRNLRASDKTEALATTQRAMLHGERPHPRYWAPFVLVGDYR